VKKIIVIAFVCVFLFNTQAVFSQIVRTPVSAPYLGPGAYSNDHVDVFSFRANQAALARLDHASAGIYSEQRFLLKELSLYNVAIGIPTHSGNFGLNAGYFGFSNYNETECGLAYARSLGNRIDIGVQFNYWSVKVGGYGNASAINFEIGSIFHLTDKLNAGLHVQNPVGGKFGKNEHEKLASVYSAGIGYNASEKFFVSAEIEKQEDQPVNVNAGFQYKFTPQLMASAGISTATSSAYTGVGLGLRSFRVDVTAGYHQQLGITPGLSLLFNFKKK
jgi:hypothetical protein